MKKPVVIFICILLALCAGCGSDEPEQSVFAIDPLQSAAPEPAAPLQTAQAAPVAATPAPVEAAVEAAPDAATPDPNAPPAPALTVSDTVAYVFEGLEGATLYGAAAYQNTGNCPIVITGASLAFSVGGTPMQFDYIPVMNQNTIVFPGETSFIAYWHADSALTVGASASLAATLNCTEAGHTRTSVSASNVYLADNYPGFTTMTGRLTADSPCSLNLVYTGFYDAGGKLLGVWHFTKNASLDAGDSKTFAVHMRELPVDGLAAKTAEIKTFGVGF